MKKIVSITAMAVIACLSANAQQPTAVADTVLNVTDADVIVSQNDEGLTIDVVESGKQMRHTYDYPYTPGETYVVERTYQSPATFVCCNNISLAFSGFSVGFVKAMDAPADMGLEMGKSLELSLDQILSLQWRLPGKHDMLAVGIGLDWRNYRMTGDKCFALSDDGVILSGFADGEAPVDSRLKTFSLQFPVSYVHTFSRFTKVGVAVILNANTYGSLKSHYTCADGAKRERFSKCSSDIRKFSVDFKATLQFCPVVALYCKWSPMKVFKDGRGPEFTPLSAGFTFFY